MACIATMKTEEDVLAVVPQLDEVHKVTSCTHVMFLTSFRLTFLRFHCILFI
jgi:hypothetical protein